GEPDSPEQQEEQELPAPVRVLDALEAPLLLEASWKQAAEKLVAQGPEIIPALCGYLAIKDVSVQRAIEETLKAFADEHLEAIHAYVLRGDTRPRIQRYVLFVLGEIGDNASAEVFLRFLGAEQERVQAMALRGCARLGVQVPDTLLAAFGAGTRRSLRRYLALALESSGSSPALQALCRLLADRDLQVRHAAYSVLQHKGKRAQPFLKALQQQPELLPSIRAMIRELLKERER
ncbi:MAG: hypothetical protein GY868_05775, partial [Deltaproteobacteria bacterium]|nr:hypothetical protein [Deltaproteobacteria bacterium]